jgi:hypothetical protein
VHDVGRCGFYPKIDRATVILPEQKPVGIGLVSQALILTGEQFLLLTHTATTESASLCMPTKSSARL